MDEKVVSRRGGSMKQVETLRMKAILESVPLAIGCVTQWAETAGFDERALYNIQLAVDEACANVVDHAYQGTEPGDMEISCFLNEQVLIIRVRDWGRGFDPEAVSEPDVEAPLEERTLGGLGLFLVKQVMDHVQFSCDPVRGNELMMTKRLRVGG
jgi:serine/threonine-protein kinase RsbW